MKRKFYLLVLFISALTFNSCENDDFNNDYLDESNPELSINIINQNKLKENYKVLSKIASINSKLSKFRLQKSSSPLDSNLNFTVDTLQSTHLQYGNFESYSFLINRENKNEDILENLMIGLKNDTINSINLFQYELKEGSDLYDLQADDFEHYTQIVLPLDLEFASQL